MLFYFFLKNIFEFFREGKNFQFLASCISDSFTKITPCPFYYIVLNYQQFHKIYIETTITGIL